jgi:RNA polymerase sigma factor (sigma-70 family)
MKLDRTIAAQPSFLRKEIFFVIDYDPTGILTTYCIEIESIQELSEAEQYALVSAAGEQGTTLDRETRNRILESSLPLVKSLAFKYCPRPYWYLMPDILGDLNLTLLRALDRFQPHTFSSVRSYICAFVKGAVKDAIMYRPLIHVTRYQMREAVQQGTPELLKQWNTLSLERQKERRLAEGEELAMFPLLPTEARPEPPAEKQALVSAWLAHLPARDEHIVRLYYGLCDEDESPHSIIEITRLLDLPYETVYCAFERSLQRLKKLAEDGSTQFQEKDGRQIVTGFRPRPPLPTLTAVQEQQLWQFAHDLCNQGTVVTVESLTRASKLSQLLVVVFLRQHRHELPQQFCKGTPERKKQRKQERMQCVRQVYERFLAEGRPLINEQIAQEAQVGIRTVRAFLYAQKQARQ